MYPLLFVASRGASSSQALQVLSFKKGGSQVLRCLQGVSTSTDICSNKYQESDQGCHAELQGHVLVSFMDIFVCIRVGMPTLYVNFFYGEFSCPSLSMPVR